MRRNTCKKRRPGRAAAIDYVERIGMDRIARYEHDLLAYGTQRLQPIPGVRLVGTAANKASVLSFVVAGYKTEEVGTELNREGIAVRSGHHCAQLILRRFGVETTVRPSFAFYNTCASLSNLAPEISSCAHPVSGSTGTPRSLGSLPTSSAAFHESARSSRVPSRSKATSFAMRACSKTRRAHAAALHTLKAG